MVEPLGLIAESLTFIFPAYCANAIPVLAGGGRPLDFGREFIDGRPILGKNKTFRGFISGLIAGTTVGLIESWLLNYPPLFGFFMSIGALMGDLTGAFAKRRIGLSSGEPLPVVDQLSFLIGAILFSFPIFWNRLSWELVAVAISVTLPIHVLTNFAAYKVGLKSHPW